MSDTSSNSSLHLISSGAAASALPPENNHQSNSDEQSHDMALENRYKGEDTPPLLPRSVNNQMGPNRPLPASPIRQQSFQR